MSRRYHSPKRDQQRIATRATILGSAHEMFVRLGYHGTTVDAVARSAGVSAETIYSTFRSKRNLLREVARAAAVGDAATMLAQDWFDRVVAEPDQRRRWELMRSGTAGVLGRTRALDAVVRAAAVSDPAVAELWQEMEAERRKDVRVLVDLLADAGPLSVPKATAVDLMWGLSRTTGLFEALTLDRRWSVSRAEAAVSDAIAAAILPVPFVEDRA